MTHSFNACLLGEGRSRYEEKKSVFYGIAFPVDSETDARNRLEQIKHEFSDASHFVYAYFIEEGYISRYTDDGEPQGTAGLPCLNVIKAKQLRSAMVVVIRYFGGTLLGTGGLTKAYSTCAKEALENAGMGELKQFSVWNIPLSYSAYQKVSVPIQKLGGVCIDSEFSDNVRLTIRILSEKDEMLMTLIKEFSGGQSVPVFVSEVELPV